MSSTAPAPKIAVVIPCYRVRAHILDVVHSLPAQITHVFAVDDRCPEQSGRLLEEQCRDPRLKVVFHTVNQGVGGATISGYRAALEAGCDIVVKMDGDGQMDPAFLPRLVNPILAEHADFTKGNRFHDLDALRQMPLVRRIGNFGLTLLTKFAAGCWHIADPTNGYTAIHHTALRVLPLDRISRRYFFETSMLIHLNIARAVAVDVPIPARYGNETSSLSIWRSLFGFPPRLAAGLVQRLFWRYFIYDINAVTVLLAAGLLSTTGGAAFGALRWWQSGLANTSQTAGTIALVLLPLIVGFQMLLQAILLDVVDRPRLTLSRLIHDRWTPPS